MYTPESMELLNAYKDKILELYRKPSAVIDIWEALKVPCSVESVHNWIRANVSDAERLKHRYAVYNKRRDPEKNDAYNVSRQHYLPRDGSDTPKFCGNCDNWTPYKNRSFDMRRYGICEKSGNETERCKECEGENNGRLQRTRFTNPANAAAECTAVEDSRAVSDTDNQA